MWGSACSHSSSSCGCHEATRGSLASAAPLLSLTITVCVCVCASLMWFYVHFVAVRL